ncbi:MAG TPA: hypothetical protein VMT35_03160, partial [Ignavibacteriaceae bacterium]|nr:hypothetical protein [Ignavibacteriaceae bacterium]
MGKTFSILVSILFLAGLSNELFAQWAQNKNAREDAIYARVLQGSEDVTIDGVEDPIWASADSVVLGYGVTKYLPSSGYNWITGEHVEGDSANVVFKCLFKNPYLYLLFKVVDKNVGGVDWEQSDGMIISFKSYVRFDGAPKTHDITGFNMWDFRVEHFPMFGWKWAGLTSQPDPGSQPILRGDSRVQNGGDTTLTQWQQFTSVIGGMSYDSLDDQGWISEHRMNIDSMNFNVNGDIIPFSFCMWDGDGFMDSTASNNRFNKVWWGNEWNETWYYNALYIDPNVTTSSTGGVIPPVDYTIPRLRQGDAITIDGDLSDWKPDNTLHFAAKWGDEASFDSIKGTGKWASGYQEYDWNSKPTVVDGPAVDYWVTYDDTNLYVGAQIADQIVTVPGEGGRSDGVTFFIVGRNYVNGSGIMGNVKELTVNIDSSGSGVAANDLISMADTAGVKYNLVLGDQTDVNDPENADNGYSVELKIPFSALNYPQNLGDSVVFIGGLTNDIDVFADASSNYYAKSWWFKWEKGQTSPAWVVLGPANT